LGAIICAVLFFCGCTVIGYMVGDAVDRSLPPKVIVPGWEVAKLIAGDSLEIVATDGTVLSATYDGMGRLSRDAYAARYALSMQKDSVISLPALGDSVNLRSPSSNEYHGPFAGWGTWPEPFMVVGVAGDASGQEIRLDQLASLSNGRGVTFDLKRIKQRLTAGKIASLSALSLQSDSMRRLFPVDSILQVQIPYHGSGKIIGLLLGMAVDGAAYYAITSWHKAYDKGYDEGYPEGYAAGYSAPPTGGSCPHVYSHDGHGYVIDSEPYAGAMVEALQRTDIDNLDHLRERHGRCKLLVSNGVEETEHVDAVSLLMVEHSHGVRVVPSFDGSLHTVRQAMPPVAAFDERGADILPLVAVTDERIWSSNPFGRNPAEMSQVRDGIELDFARPAGAQTAKLLVNVENTVWAGSMLKRMLQLHGRDLPGFYDQLNASEFMRNLLGNALIREGALLIKIWNGLEWTDGGYIFDVGSRVAKDQIVLLNLEQVVGDTLRLRFESTAGFWKMNSAAVDYSPDLPVTTVEVFPEKAVTEQGQNVLDALRTIDHHYYEMSDPQNRAELVFHVPPRAARLDRSYLLKCTGYYTIHVAAEGDPQTELIFRLALVPGAFGQYALQTLNEQTLSALSPLLPK
jgi:hypothetical protein